MFTRCPDCLTPQRISPVTLRTGRGMVRCKRCSKMFDALESLAETEKLAVADVQPSEEPWTESKARNQLIWRIGLPLGVVLLCVQLLYFEGSRAIQNPKIRPALEKICGLAHCRLPDYRNLAEWSVLRNSFSEMPNGHYSFDLVLNNEAVFPMPYPNIGLTLLSFGGQPFAHRLFQSSDYLAGQPENALLAANSAAEIRLEIAAPKTKVGGFHFDLSY